MTLETEKTFIFLKLPQYPFPIAPLKFATRDVKCKFGF